MKIIRMNFLCMNYGYNSDKYNDTPEEIAP